MLRVIASVKLNEIKCPTNNLHLFVKDKEKRFVMKIPTHLLFVLLLFEYQDLFVKVTYVFEEIVLTP